MKKELKIISGSWFGYDAQDHCIILNDNFKTKLEYYLSILHEFGHAKLHKGKKHNPFNKGEVLMQEANAWKYAFQCTNTKYNIVIRVIALASLCNYNNYKYGGEPISFKELVQLLS